MGQTLENGVYLPSEGERNCYAGLKTNWEILDQKVADVTALQQAVAGALHREIVESLPTTDIDPNTIYMILSGTSATENVYNEFMYVNNAWELIGTSATDLTNYYTKAEVDGKLLLKASASDLTSHTGDTTIHVTTADKTKWNNGVSQSYVLRYSSSSVTDNSTIAYSTLDNTDNIKSGDKVIDVDGKIFAVVSVDTANQTVTVGTALIDLALDANVMHLSGNESASGDKNFQGLLTTIPNETLWTTNTNTTADITSLGGSSIHLEYKSSGKLTDLSSGAWNVVELGDGCFFFRYNSGTDIRYKHFPTNLVNRIYVVNGANRHINNLIPDQDNTRDVGSNSLRWATFNGINPGALSLPDLNNGIDISSYINTGDSDNSYTPLVDGYISVRVNSTNSCALYTLQGELSTCNYGYIVDIDLGGFICSFFIPVVKNVACRIICRRVQNVVFAKFFPCQGNV